MKPQNPFAPLLHSFIQSGRIKVFNIIPYSAGERMNLFASRTLKLSLVLLFFLFTGCSENHVTPKVIEQGPVSQPKVTIFSTLPDSIQPKVIHLDELIPPIIKPYKEPAPIRTFKDSVSAETLAPASQGIGNFVNYNSDHGLASDNVICTMLDTKRRLWFGTFGEGISIFDGSSFTNYTTLNGLPSNNISCLFEAENGIVWIGTWEGLVRFDGLKMETYTVKNGLPADDVRSIAEDKEGKIWIGTWGGGVSCYSQNKFITYDAKDGIPNNIIRSIFLDRNGLLWFGTWGGGVVSYDGHSFKTYTTTEGLVNNDIWCIEEDIEGNLWFAAYEGGVSKYDGKNFQTFTTRHGMPGNSIRIIKRDRTGHLWFGSREGGVSCYNGSGFINLSTANGLPNNTINAIIEDSEDNLWFSTYGNGVTMYKGPAFIIYTTAQGLSNNRILSIVETKSGDLWLGSWEAGASKYTGQSFITVSKKDELIDDNIWSIIEDKSGRLWFGTDFGFSILDGEKFISHDTSHALKDFTVLSIYQARNGIFWLGSSAGGLYKYDGTLITNFNMDHGLAKNNVTSIKEDQAGRIWINYGIGTNISCLTEDRIITFSEAHGLNCKTINCITFDRHQNLLIGTNAGMYFLSGDDADLFIHKIFRGDSLDSVVFRPLVPSSHLKSMNITQIVEGENGHLFIGSSSGISVWKGGYQAFSNPDSIEHYFFTSGHPVKDVMKGNQSMIQDKNGDIWIATSAGRTGLIRFDYSSIKRNKNKPSITIQKIQLHNTDVNWSKDSLQHKFRNLAFDSLTPWYPLPVNLKLPYGLNNISFQFNTNSTSSHNEMKYQFILEGYDEEWSPLTANRKATFGHISEGHYTFKVKARSPEGLWSDPLAYSFSVLPPIHRAWWAYTLYVLTFCSASYLIHNYQRRRIILKEQEKAKQKQAILNERLRISRDLHDEVGSTLSGIAMYSHIAKEQIKTESRDVVFNSLNVMQESAGEMVNKLNDIVWLLNPEKAQLHQLIEKLEVYAEKMAEIKNIQVTTAINERVSAIELSIEVRKNIYLIFKEAINNAVKYSQANSLHILVEDKDHTLNFILEDNGIGFDPDQVKKGNGLDNMHSRAKEIGAHLNLDTSPGKGTRLSLVYIG